MEINITLTATDIVAWWGAIIATFVLIWDVYKWKTSGPKLRLEVGGNRITVNIPATEGRKFIMATVNNTGDLSTTITNLCLAYYPRLIDRIFNKSKTNMVIVRPSPGDHHPPPYVIEPGAQWVGMAEQDNNIERMAKEGHLVCQVYYSSHKKPVQQRVVL